MATSARANRSSNTTAGALTVFTTAKRSEFFRSSSSSFLCFFRFHLVSWSYLQIIKAKLVKIISKCRGFLTFDNCKPRQSAYCTNTERTDIRKDEKATDDNKEKKQRQQQQRKWLHHQGPSAVGSRQPRCHTAPKNSISVGLAGDF